MEVDTVIYRARIGLFRQRKDVTLNSECVGMVGITNMCVCVYKN